MLLISAQGHVLLKGRQGAVNAGLPVTTAQGLGQQGLVKAFPSRHLGRQEHGALFLVAMPNLVHHGITGLGRQLAAAPRTVLSAELAV